MFNRGVVQLLESLPELDGLDTAEVRRLLSRAWFATQAHLDAGEIPVGAMRDVENLRRLATALEVHLVLMPGLTAETVQASAFVAAEALDIATLLSPGVSRPWLFGDHERFERVEIGLLFLIAGNDANAAVVARAIQTDPDSMTATETWLLQTVQALLTMRVDDVPLPQDERRSQHDRRERIRDGIMRRIGESAAAHLRWLALESDDRDVSLRELQAVINGLESHHDGLGSAEGLYADLYHLAKLLYAAIDGTTGRALRSVPAPEGGDRFGAFQKQQAATRPLLWPAVAAYAATSLPGPSNHAVVTVPTGAGKSAVADLAIAQALHHGWVLYLAPTNALTGQIKRQLERVFADIDGVRVREFTGGMEYSALEADALERITDREILVMTPEKCTLVLRQHPEAFTDLRLCVLDEAHLLGKGDARARITELVIAEILLRAPENRMLLLSALIANPEEIAGWLHTTTGVECPVVKMPWRPTRTLRVVVGVEMNLLKEQEEAAEKQISSSPETTMNIPLKAPITFVGGLQGNWKSSKADDFAVVRTKIATPLVFHRKNRLVDKGYVNRTVEVLAQSLAEHGQQVLVFLPRSKHDSFSVAAKLFGFPLPSNQLDPDIDALLTLAETELGAASQVRSLLKKGISVHTGGMLLEERRASEISFERSIAPVMFATGTMSQGLNLPATTVIIGGTQVGGPDNNRADSEENRKADLLNAIGRAGRANVAARSMAIFVPDKLKRIPTGLAKAAAGVVKPPFFDDEDASSIIESHLTGLVTKALDGTLQVWALEDEEQAAFAILSHQGHNEEVGAVLRRTWAATELPAEIDIGIAANHLQFASRQYLTRHGCPERVAAAAHKAGIGLPTAVALHRFLEESLRIERAPETLNGWAELTVRALASMDNDGLALALPSDVFGSSRLQDLYADDESIRAGGWQVLNRALQAWIAGEPLLNVAWHTEWNDPREDATRSSRSPIPRIWRIVDNGFKHWLARIGGGIGAIINEGIQAEPWTQWDLSQESARMLALLPLAIRYGADTPTTIAWMRAGARPRVVAHLLDDLVQAPEGLGDEALHQWAWQELQAMESGASLYGRTAEEQKLLQAFTQTRT